MAAEFWRNQVKAALPNHVNGRLPWDKSRGGRSHACRNGHRLPEHRPRGLRPPDLPERARARRHGRAAGLRIDLVGRAPFHRLHDVPRRRAVPVLHGRPHAQREARLDGRGPALARSDARRRADLDARPALRRPHDPGPRPRRGQGRVRRLPPRHGRQPRAVRRVRRGAAQGPRERRDGIRRQALPPAADGDPPGAVQELPRPHLCRGRQSRERAHHGPARRRPADHPAEAVARGREGARASTTRSIARSTAPTRRSRSRPAGSSSTRAPSARARWR